MNENIKRIANTTNFTIADSPIWCLKVEEFAQAIARECANISDQSEPYKAHDNILKHFGIE
jgi:hypothetical protein